MRQRAKVVPEATGRVLEIGIGSGLNLALYDRDRVEAIIGLDPSSELREMARTRAREAGLDVEWIPLGGESIPLGDASVDTVVPPTLVISGIDATASNPTSSALGGADHS